MTVTTSPVDRVRHGFTDRGTPGSRVPYDANLAVHVGDDPHAVASQRIQLLRRTDATRLCFVRQVHGRTVIGAPQSGDGVIDIADAADALLTTTPGTAVAVLTADCLPVLLVDPSAGVAAAAHAGRQGLVAGVLTATVTAMVRAGADTGRMRSWIGPAICGRCYEVPAAMRDELAGVLPGAAATTSWGTPSLDLPAAARRQLAGLGVSVHGPQARCTFEDPRLFSYRRDGVTGRSAGWIMVG